jgi:3-oxoacyl-[acyl-carrier-protein] synthase III
MIQAALIGSGSYIPDIVVRNSNFANHQFFEADGSKMYKNSATIITKFEEITGIYERRYARREQVASDLAVLSAEEAITTSGIDRESLDYLIVAHNFGDVAVASNRVSMVPSLASRVKALLKINNPDCVAYDLAFGCPGWIEGVIQANYYIRSGDAKRCMVIGAETLSRVIDDHDRDSMIYSDGSGAVIFEAHSKGNGIISHCSRTYANESDLLKMSGSYSSYATQKDNLYLKMTGRKVYEFALKYVPAVIKSAIDKAGLTLTDIKKVLVHQANEKMDFAILSRLFELYNIKHIPEGIMPMTIGWLGNSSVATVPTLLDMVMKNKLDGHRIEPGDNVVMASVGAGMNINAIVYRV